MHDAGSTDVKKYPFIYETEFKISSVFKLLYASLPNIFVSFGLLVLLFSSMYYTNRSQNSELVAGYGLGVTCHHSLIYFAIISLNSGYFTQASQAYGAGRFADVAQLLHKCLFTNISWVVLVLPLILMSKTLLLSFGIDPEVAEYASTYLHFSLPSIFSISIWETFNGFMMAQGEFHWPMYVQNISYGLSIVYGWIFVGVLDWGIIGLAMVRNSCDLTALGIIIYLMKNKYKDSPCLKPFKRDSLKNLRGYLALTVPMGVLTYMEWFFFEIQTILIGFLGNTEALAAHGSFQAIFLLFFMLPNGTAQSINSFMGNLVGEQNMLASKTFVKVSIAATTSIWLIALLFQYLSRDFFFTHMTTTDEMRYWYEKIYYTYQNFYLFGDSFQVNLSSIMRCIGLQNLAAGAFFGIYYIFGVPLSLFLTFLVGFGTLGSWYTLAITSFLVSMVFLYKIYHNDWQLTFKKMGEQFQTQESLSDKDLSDISHDLENEKSIEMKLIYQ